MERFFRWIEEKWEQTTFVMPPSTYGWCLGVHILFCHIVHLHNVYKVFCFFFRSLIISSWCCRFCIEATCYLLWRFTSHLWTCFDCIFPLFFFFSSTCFGSSTSTGRGLWVFVLFCTFPLTFACYQRVDIFIAVDADFHMGAPILKIKGLNDRNFSLHKH